MNLSIYIKLWIASNFSKVKISDKFKHLDYMIENEFIKPIYDGITEFNGWPTLTHSNFYEITSIGKKEMWTYSHLLSTRVVAWLALFISLTAVLITYSNSR